MAPMPWPATITCSIAPRVSRAHVRCARGSRAWLVRVRVKQLLAGDFVAGNSLLTLGRDQVVDELLAERFLYGRVLRRVDQHDSVLVEQPFVTLDQYLQIRLIPKVDPGRAV